MLNRIWALLAFIFAILTIFTGRLIFLQVLSAAELLERSNENISVQRRITPLRGRILARDGTVLADNRIASDLMYRGGEIEHWQKLRYLLKLSDKPQEPDRSDPIERKQGKALAYNIPDDLVAATEELVAGQSNLYLRRRLERVYPTGLAAHVVGYTAEAQGKYEGYSINDLVGITGIEESFQKQLFGSPGSRTVKVDNRGVDIRTQEYRTAEPGKDIVLTIDPRIQEMAEDVLANSLGYINEQRLQRDYDFEEVLHGALIVLDPNNGEILAMASHPGYDQNVFTKRPSDPEKVSELLSDRKNMPLQNRAIQAYPPASTFKLITSSTILEDGFVSAQKKYRCSQQVRFGGITWENWATYDRGNYNVVEAIADSCNTYFWRVAIDTVDFKKGWSPYIESLTKRAFEFGYGQRVGIGLDEEKSGRIPTEDWSLSFMNQSWRPGDSLNVSIGQGDVLATPIQVAQLIETIAEDGLQYKPHLVKRIAFDETKISSREIKGRYWPTLKEGMRHMITDHGTSRLLGPAANFPVKIAGKTGTAQNSKGLGYEHVWFSGFAPLDNPEIVLVVFVEHGDRSTAVAVPMARDFFVQYFGVADEN